MTLTRMIEALELTMGQIAALGIGLIMAESFMLFAWLLLRMWRGDK